MSESLFAKAQNSDEVKSQDILWKRYTDALRGDKVAQYQTGVMYERGLGVEVNTSHAAEWYKKSALQGYIDSQYNLGILYATGRGVEKSDAFAIMWLGLAAKQGDQEARRLLLQLIDQEVDKKSEKTDESQMQMSLMAENEIFIAPLTLICKKKSSVCTQYKNKGECDILRKGSVLTTKEKKGEYYKISGIVMNGKWKGYPKEGWIDENSVDIRH
ncbi:MAG: sel1 repeat family protein [Sulfuricurvum sp.]|uniref:tetratricopeptide repeat protein n=1 Tax=Sulfuricurvum sp. TaxID=2025608 RepID=UPI0025EE8657|nr:tetratricopeptide repeat protein [Sulfuricurvum sp.]MCK9371652.1 sel1 repeat family protein [Sulfuricurvum sp.]